MFKVCIQYSENFQGNSVFQGKRSCSKILNCEKYIQYSEKFLGKLCFQCKRKLLKNRELWKNFNTVYIIHFGAIRVIWASVGCNLDQSRDWL